MPSTPCGATPSITSWDEHPDAPDRRAGSVSKGGRGREHTEVDVTTVPSVGEELLYGASKCRGDAPA